MSPNQYSLKNALRCAAVAVAVTGCAILLHTILVARLSLNITAIYSIPSTRPDLFFFLHASDINEIGANLTTALSLALLAWLLRVKLWIYILGLLAFFAVGSVTTLQYESAALLNDCDTAKVTADFCGTSIVGARIGGYIMAYLAAIAVVVGLGLITHLYTWIGHPKYTRPLP